MNLENLWPKIVTVLSIIGIGWLALTTLRVARKFAFFILIVAVVAWFYYPQIKGFVTAIFDSIQNP